MSFVSGLFSASYNWMFPSAEEAQKTDAFRLFVGPLAQGTLPAHAAQLFPDRDYQFIPLRQEPNRNAADEVDPNGYLIKGTEESSPFISGPQIGVFILLRSQMHLGVVNVQRDDIKPFKEALNQIGQESPEVFIIGGKGRDSSRYQSICQFIQSYNKRFGSKVKVGDDLFKLLDFQGPTPSQVPCIQYAGFDEASHPIAVIDYR